MLVDHTPIIGWLIEGLTYTVKLARDGDIKYGKAIINGLTGLNLMLERWVAENAPMSLGHWERLEDLAFELRDVLKVLDPNDTMGWSTEVKRLLNIVEDIFAGYTK